MAVRLLDYAIRGNLRKVKRCINSGVDVDSCERSGNSALYHAVSRNQQKCVEYLLSCGADPDRINKKGYTPVNEACFNNNVECLALLVQHGGSLDKLSADHKESAIVSAYKNHSTKVIKFINLLKDEALTKDGHDLLELEAGDKQQEVENNTIQCVVLPGLDAVIPQITCAELKTPHIKLIDDMPHMTLQSALWHSTPVTVKRFKGEEDSRRLLLKEADLLSWLRHPRVSLLMAVCLGPQPEHFCLVIEHFELASLNHLLYKTQIEMNLPQRVHLLLDVAEGMTYLHNHSIVHGFLNSFSVLVYDKFRAKIGNLEFSQEDGEQKHECACSVHESWMAPEQLLHEPPNKPGDAYSFGAMMWETLARKLPWSWLTCSAKHAICDHQMTLPMLEIWPSYVRSIMTECLQDPADRPCLSNLHKWLLAIKNSGDDLTSEVLDEAFPEWLDQRDTAHIKKGRESERKKTSSDLLKRFNTRGASEIYVMVRPPAFQGNKKRRRSSVRGGLISIMKAFSNSAHKSPQVKEIERFGYGIAERLTFVRGLRGVSQNHKRDRWAREVVLTRDLEGDIERITGDMKTPTSTKRSEKLIGRERRHSVFNQESFERLLVTSSKYLRKDWSKVSHRKEELKNSMEGFKGKVNEELRENGKKLLTDDDSISEHSIGYEEADKTESKQASKDSLALLLSWEKNRATLKPNTDNILQEMTRSKVDIKSQSSLYDQSLRLKADAQEAWTQSSVVRKVSDIISDAATSETVVKTNSASDGEDGLLSANECHEQHRSLRNSVAQMFKGIFQGSRNSDTQTVMNIKKTSEIPDDSCFVFSNSSREDATNLKGESQSKTIGIPNTSSLNEADLSSPSDFNAKQLERLRTRSLGSTSCEKLLSARRCCQPRTMSARYVRVIFQGRTNSDTPTAMNTKQTLEIPADSCFGISNTSRGDATNLKGKNQSKSISVAYTSSLNEADLSSSSDFNAKQLETRSLGSTSSEKPLSSRKSYKPRARSARYIRVDTASLSSQRGMSGASTVVSDTERTSLENKALTDTDEQSRGSTAINISETKLFPK